MMGNFGFDTRASAERVAEATRFVERTSRGGGPGQRRWPVGTSDGLTTFVRTPAEGIPAKVGNTPGSKPCFRYVWDGTSDTLGTESLTILNRLPDPVDGNRIAMVAFDQGAWWFVVEACKS